VGTALQSSANRFGGTTEKLMNDNLKQRQKKGEYLIENMHMRQITFPENLTYRQFGSAFEPTKLVRILSLYLAWKFAFRLGTDVGLNEKSFHDSLCPQLGM
jgi:hypothetical protein